MPDEARAPPAHAATEGPEESLEGVREQAHEEPGLQEKVAAAELRLGESEARASALEAREKELVERLARLQADFENFRRRSREESARASASGKETFLKALLPALDNVDRALLHSEDEGVRLLARHLEGALAAQGVTVLEPEGEPFDAKLHEAIAQGSREGAKAGTVLTVAEKGYVLDGRVVRPARVIVAE